MQRLGSHLQALSIIGVLVVVSTMTLVYRRRQVRFTEHFNFALHVGAMASLIDLVGAVLGGLMLGIVIPVLGRGLRAAPRQ